MEFVLYYLLLGAVAGVLAGLLGVGGGLVIVPALTYLFYTQGINEAVLVHLAVGTSLLTIVMTSISSVYAHHRRGAVLWPVFLHLTPGIIIGALLGAVLAEWMSSLILKRFFAVFELLVAIQLLSNFSAHPSRSLPGRTGMGSAGGVIGGISSIVGIGGGTLTVPFLVWCNVSMKNAVATSSACGLPIAIAGATGFLITGWGNTDLPDKTLGYLHLPSFLGIIISSMLFAPVGAKLAHSLPAKSLKRIFGLFLLMLSAYMFF